MTSIIIMIKVALFIAALPVWPQSSFPVFLCQTINESDEVYVFRHKSDDFIYYLTVSADDAINYEISLYDYHYNELQVISFESQPFEISFADLNLDGYTDLITNMGGALNEIHELYIWDQKKSYFRKVNYIGFHLLSYFEIEDGYIMNWVKDSAVSGSIEKLLWDGYSLIKDSVEYYELNDAGQ